MGLGKPGKASAGARIRERPSLCFQAPMTGQVTWEVISRDYNRARMAGVYRDGLERMESGQEQGRHCSLLGPHA